MARSFGGLGDLLGSSTDIDWQGDPEDLLYEGERIDERVDFGEGELVVTSHRLLVFAPESSGSQFETVDRPNVVGLGLGHDGDADLLERGIKWAFGGVALVVTSQFVDLSGLVGDVSFEGAASVGLGGLFGLLTAMLELLGRIDELMRIFGALGVILAMVMLAAYVLTRERVLTIELAGREDAVIPVPEGVERDTVERVRAALTDGGGPSGGPESLADRRDRSHVDGRGRAHDEPPADRPPDAGPLSDGRRDDGDGRFKSDDPLDRSDGPRGGT